ncbi:MAG: guanylate kinase [Myxococcota bacterium]
MSRSRTSPESGAPSLLIVLAGPSGTGKSTLVERVFAGDPRLSFSVSHTTRPPRPGEVEGVSYYYVDDATFVAMADAGAFAEWAHVHTRRYGTSKAEIQRLRDLDKDIVFDVDVQGAASLRAVYPDSVSVFILPPSMAVLEARLRGRGTESDAQLQVRLDNARKEIAQAATFDYLIVNDDLDQAAASLSAIIRAERVRTSRIAALATRLLEETTAP